MDETTDIRFDQPRSHFGTWVGVVLLFSIFALFVWAVMGMMPRHDDYEDSRGAKRVENLKKYHEEIDPQLHDYGWVDKAKGSVHVPVQRAMELTMAELAQKKPAPAGPIPAEGAQPGLQATAPATPAPAPSAAAQISPQPTPATSIHGEGSEAAGQPAAAASGPDAAPGTQPGPNATPAAVPPSRANQAHPELAKPTATPVQTAPGTPIPAAGATPR